MKQERTILSSLEWGQSISNREQKQVIANRIAHKACDGDIIGVGSGSTVYLALQSIARRIEQEQLRIYAIPTSHEIKLTCARLGIPLTSLWEHTPDWTFDGADEIDPDCNMIKGRGGAMFKEKLLITSSPKTYIVADSSKRVKKLGSLFPVPVEVFPDALVHVEKMLRLLNPTEIKLRMAERKDGPVITESGNMILDVRFPEIPSYMESAIKAITGVIESGLFIHYKVEVISSDEG
ncbi:ribose 5-phosphate isomerase A [Parabacteroides pacaensis]|uniref:ribose 5-phosphate isomerase A n=1 Tax=Parabacteroides pacaensis TaxID=2086575 RepID=UPI000D0E6D81|nr:ribose 5-phosphate isomerase A [Parabacteroides pacaensis]